MEQEDGTLLLYVNDGTHPQPSATNTADVTTVELSFLSVSQSKRICMP